jgi:acetolactate synthase-1/3 small subunit
LRLRNGARGEATINDNDDNKETGEFTLGKNVL